MSKGFSIITNFGCKTNCSYCIWKQHSMYGKTFSYIEYINAVSKFILEEITDKKFSISGGGDPLNNIKNNELFWDTIYTCCAETNKKIDIHTSYTNWDDIENNSYYINRMVLHSTCDKIYDQLKNLIEYSNYYKIRVNFVITTNININTLMFVEKELMKNNIQLSYRELVSKENINIPNEIFDFCSTLSKRYNQGKFVKQNDYNIYLMPDGKIYDKFLF